MLLEYRVKGMNDGKGQQWKAEPLDMKLFQGGLIWINWTLNDTRDNGGTLAEEEVNARYCKELI